MRWNYYSGPSIIGRLLTYEKYAMELKKKYTSNVDWYLYNFLFPKKHREKALQENCCVRCLHSATGKKWYAILKPTKKVMFPCTSISAFA